MKKNLSVIARFFSQPSSPHTLGFFRIAISVFAIVQLFVLLPDWMSLYGPKGILPWEVSEALSTNHMPGLSKVLAVLSVFKLSPVTALYLVTIIYFLSLIGLLAGYKTRVMGTLAWLMHLVLNTTGHFTAYGVETFTHISLFYCMVLPVGAAYALDQRKKPVSVPPYLITLSIRIIQLHLCIMYLASGLEKAMGSQWWNGEAIWIALQQDQFRQVDVDWMARVPVIPQVLCLGTLLVEIGYPVGILWNKTKKYWLVAILSMHFFIALFLGLHLFGALMMLLNAAAFGKECFPRLFSAKPKIRWKPGMHYKVDQVGEVYQA